MKGAWVRRGALLLAMSLAVAWVGGTEADAVPSMRPSVQSITPTSGPTSGGTSVYLHGSHLGGATAVMFGTTAASDFTVLSDSDITATSPAQPSGTVGVTVTANGLTSIASTRDQFTYQVTLPAVTGLNPNNGSAAGGTAVMIIGTAFTATRGVTFGTTSATSFTVVSANEIDAVAPAHPVGAVDVVVTTTAGSSSHVPSDMYTYTPIPSVVVGVVSPSSGPTTGGATVTIGGAGFSGATEVDFGGTAAPSFTVVSSTQIAATSPAAPTGTVDVIVHAPGGQNPPSVQDHYTFDAWTVTVNPSAVAPGVVVTYSATTSSAIPFGTVSFVIGSTTMCQAPFARLSTTASCKSSAAPVGTDTVTATLGSGGTGTIVGTTTLVVGTPSWTASATPTTFIVGASITLTATASTTPGSGIGSVEFRSEGPNSALLCRGTVKGMTAACNATTGALAVGVDAIDADITTAPQSRTVLATTTVTVMPRQWTVSVSPTNSVHGTSVNFTADVTGYVGSQSIFFTIGGTTLCTAGFNPTGVNTSTGTCRSNSAPIGTDTIVANFGRPATVVGSATLVVVPAPIVFGHAPANPVVGEAYVARLVAGGGDPPFTWVLTGGALPDGLTLATNGAITGLPTTIGPSTFTVQVTDSYTPVETASKTYTITVVPQPLVITTPATLPLGADTSPGTAYSTTLAASGGVQPLAWDVTSGALPGGLHLDTSSGTISGTPTVFGITGFAVTATDSCPANTCTAPETTTKSFSLEITGPAQVPTLVQDGYFGGAYYWTRYTDHTDGESGYVLEREAQGESAYSPIASAPAATGIGSTVVLLDATPITGRASQTNCYETVVQMPDGTSATSVPRCLTMTLPQPTNVSVTGINASQVTLSFTQPPNASSWKVTCGGRCTPVTGTASGTPSLTISGLQRATAYTFSVSSYFNSAGAYGPATAKAATTYTVVPNVTNMRYNSAASALRNNHLSPNPSSSPNGLVTGQSIAPGTAEPVGTAVSLAIAYGASSVDIHNESSSGETADVWVFDNSIGRWVAHGPVDYGDDTVYTFPEDWHTYTIYACVVQCDPTTESVTWIFAQVFVSESDGPSAGNVTILGG